jgi:hypothetical protein
MNRQKYHFNNEKTKLKYILQYVFERITVDVNASDQGVRHRKDYYNYLTFFEPLRLF